MIRTAGTVVGKGPNAVGTTDAPIRELNFMSMTDNAAVDPGTNTPGPNNPPTLRSGFGTTDSNARPLEGKTIVTADTQSMKFPSGGTLMAGGSGEKWKP